MRKIKVGIIQQANTADLRTNLMNLAKSIEACAAHGAQLIVLQELHNSLYFCQTENTQLFDLAETIPGPSTGFYSELAAANKIVLVTSLFEKRAPGLYHNTAVVFAVAALAVSAIAAQAAGVNFEDNYPSQQATQSNVSRAQVAAQTAQAMAKHAMPVQGDEYVVPASQQGSTLSREQVRKEAAAANVAGQLDFGA